MDPPPPDPVWMVRVPLLSVTMRPPCSVTAVPPWPEALQAVSMAA